MYGNGIVIEARCPGVGCVGVSHVPAKNVSTSKHDAREDVECSTINKQE